MLLLLISAQGIATAHEVVHWDQPSQELCRTCSLTSGHDAVATAEAGYVDCTAITRHLADQPKLGIVPLVLLAYGQRAPPVSL